MGCLVYVMVGQLKGMGMRLLTRKHDGGDYGPGPGPIPLNSKLLVLLSVSINNIMSDVCVVINDDHHLRGEGGGAFIKELHDRHVGHACNNCNGSTICISSTETSA